MNSSLRSTKNEEPCIVYPWDVCDEDEMNAKANFQNNYLDHMSNLKLKSKTPSNTLTTIACGVLPNVTKELIEEYCENGVSMVVFSFEGLSREQCLKFVNEIRQGVFNFSLKKNDRIPYSMALVLDLEGSRIKTGSISTSEPNQNMIELPTNGHVYVTNDITYKNKCTENRIYVTSNSILRLKEHDRIYLDYGKIELVVKTVDADEVYCNVYRGEFLGSRRSVHIAGIPIGTTSLSEKDEENVRIGIELKVDIILIPGVRNAEFFKRVKKFVCDERGTDIDLYAKIDNSVGLECIDEIIKSADGVFLHRPNLSMELGYHRIFLAQKIVLTKCNIMGKPSVTYGGFLNSMERNAMPASSDVNDVVNAVLDGTDCIYLSVTKRSEHQVHCVEFASSLCRQGEAAIWKQQLFSELNNKSKTPIDPAHAISIGCVEVSLKCNAAAIIVITTSGLSAKIIARYRPMCPVMAILRHGKCARKISVWRNLIALHYIDPIETVWSKDVENRTKLAMKFAKKKGILNQGDLILHMRCSKQNAGFANNMSLFYVSEGDLADTC